MILSLSLTVLFAATAMCLPPGLQPMLDGRIVGGEDVSISQYPWQISIEYKVGHRCGGSIYKSNVIVTAAHCVIGTNTSLLNIRIGTDQKGSGGQLVSVKEYIYHEKFSIRNMDYDVAVLILADHIKETETTKAIALATTEPAHGAISHVTGWGALSENGSCAKQLQAVIVPIVARSKCAERYGSHKVTGRMICAGIFEGGKDACQGDSGGPLVVDGKLAAIVSWGYGCARPNMPGVYSNVVDLKDWIEENSQAE